MLLNINSTSLLKFVVRCTISLYNTRLCHLLSTENEQRKIPPGRKDNRIVPSANKSPIERSCAIEEDALASEGFCTVSCLSPNLNCETESYLHYNTTESISVTSSAAVEDPCLNTWQRSVKSPAERDLETHQSFLAPPQSIAYEPTWESLEDEVIPVIIRHEAVNRAVLAEPETLDFEPLQQLEGDCHCQMQTDHILRGTGWRSCQICLESVERLASQVLA